MKRLFLVVASVCAVSFPLPAQQGGNTVRRSAKAIPSQYIVVLQPQEDVDAVAAEAVNRFNGRLKHLYRSALRGFAIQLPAGAAETLARDPRVRLVEEDSIVEVSQSQDSPPWGLDRIDQRALPLDQGFYYGVGTAQAVTVHVIDTGIRPTHQEFAGRAFIFADYVDDDGDGDPTDVGNDDSDPSVPDGQDCHGHGTHVAGTIAGVNTGVAKYAIIQAHRALGCNGSGSTSGIIAAIDAVTADVVRPAVVNMSLGGGASTALDDAVRRSIAEGVTYVLAAGNSNKDASTTSPARVAEAITVGSTTSADARSSFSNYGPVLDLFAPGSSIVSAAHTSDTGRTTMSGTSMATPHVAGVVAAFLARNPTATPDQVRTAIVSNATPNVVTGAGTGSPNLLVYSAFVVASDPVVTVLSPNGGEKLFTETPFTIAWEANDPDGLSQIDLYSSADGATYTPIPGCTALPADARSCVWAAPGPATSTGRVKVVARDTVGDVGADVSNASVTVVAAAAAITVTSPNTAVNWGRHSTQQIKWSHNLGANAYVAVELSRDGGITFSESIAPAVKNSSSSSGVYTWSVTGPNVSNAVVRVRWVSGPTSDVSNVGFIIADPFISVPSPSAMVSWGYDTLRRVTWKSNLGALDLVQVMLAPDGTTPTYLLASNRPATSATVDVRVPVLSASTATGRLRLIWSNAPAGVGVEAANPAAIKIEPAFITVTAANGGEIWTVGKSGSVRWTSNLGSLEKVSVRLSTDEGLTYAFTLTGSTKDDGSQSFTTSSSWVTTLGRVSVAWVRSPGIADASNSNFTIR